MNHEVIMRHLRILIQLRLIGFRVEVLEDSVSRKCIQSKHQYLDTGVGTRATYFHYMTECRVGDQQ